MLSREHLFQAKWILVTFGNFLNNCNFFKDITNFKWDRMSIGTNIEVTENDTKIFLKESAYMFRTAIGDQVFYLFKKHQIT